MNIYTAFVGFVDEYVPLSSSLSRCVCSVKLSFVWISFSADNALLVCVECDQRKHVFTKNHISLNGLVQLHLQICQRGCRSSFTAVLAIHHTSITLPAVPFCSLQVVIIQLQLKHLLSKRVFGCSQYVDFSLHLHHSNVLLVF